MAITLTKTMVDRMAEVVAGLNEEQEADFKRKGYTHVSDTWHVGKTGYKFTELNVGNSGAFLVENTTGELFNIKGFGVPDYNKKKKADIGNLFTVDPKVLFTKRWNYLR